VEASLADVPSAADPDEDGYTAYRRMRRARRYRLLGSTEALFDRFYQGYLTVFFVALATAYLASLLHEQPTSPAQLADVHTFGPAALGLALVVVLGLGARSGVRGGPLAITPADVLYVLQSPISRARVLRPTALRKLASWTTTGLLVGAASGFLASLRLPGGRGPWVATGLLFGACAGAGAAGTAMAVSGLRLPSRPVTVVTVAVTGYGCAAVAAGAPYPPFGWIGQMALFPLFHRPATFVVVAPIAAVVLVGLVMAPALSLEAAERRAALTSRIKFGLATRDFRTVIVLSRALSRERPRIRPLVRLRPGGGRRFAVWKRDVQGALRWPAARIARVAALGLLVGLAARGAWAGVVWTVPLGAVAAWLLGVDVCGAVAVEAEHADRARGFPVAGGGLVLRHLPVPGVLALVAAVVAIGGATIAGASGGLPAAGALLVVPGAVAALGAGLLTDLQGEKRSLDVSPEITGPVYLALDVLPLAVAGTGLLPVFEAGVASRQGLGLFSGALAWVAVPIAVGIVVGCWAVAKGDT